MGVAWRDDCNDSAKVTEQDGRGGASTRAGTVWGEGTAVLEVRGKHVGDCAEALDWQYVVSADPVPGEEDGGSWVRLVVPASAPDGVETTYLAERKEVVKPKKYVDAVEAAGCAVTGVSLATKEEEERLDRYDDNGTALLEVSCSPAADGWQLEPLVDAIREYPDCKLVGISLAGENYPFPETTIDALPESVEKGETLVLRCDTGERRFVAPPAASTPTPTVTNASTRSTTATSTPTSRLLETNFDLSESTWRYFVMPNAAEVFNNVHADDCEPIDPDGTLARQTEVQVLAHNDGVCPLWYYAEAEGRKFWIHNSAMRRCWLEGEGETTTTTITVRGGTFHCEVRRVDLIE